MRVFIIGSFIEEEEKKLTIYNPEWLRNETIKLLMQANQVDQPLLPRFEALPSRSHQSRPVITIGFIGMPFSGKSSLIKLIRDKLILTPEIDYVEQQDIKKTKEFKDMLHLRSRERLTAADHAIQSLKLIEFSEDLLEITKLFSKKVRTRDERKKIVYIGDRGLDILAWERAIFIEQNIDSLGDEVLDLHYILHPFLHPEFTGGFVYLSALSLTSLRFFDAIVICDNTLNGARRFRKAAGLEPEGMIVNPINWPTVHRGYEWFYEYVVPWMIKYYGTGFKVIHADRPEKEISEEVYQYLKKIIFAQDV